MVAGTAADIAFQPLADILFRQVFILFDKFDRTHNHAWGTKTTLQTVIFVESLLHGVQIIAICDALNSGDVRTICLGCQHRA